MTRINDETWSKFSSQQNVMIYTTQQCSMLVQPLYDSIIKHRLVSMPVSVLDS